MLQDSDPIISARDATTARCCFFFIGHCSVNAQSIIFLLSHSSAGGVQEMWADLAEGFRTRGFDVRLMALYPYLETAPTRGNILHGRTSSLAVRRPSEKILAYCDLCVHLFKTEPSDLLSHGDAGSKRADSFGCAHGRRRDTVSSFHTIRRSKLTTRC